MRFILLLLTIFCTSCASNKRYETYTASARSFVEAPVFTLATPLKTPIPVAKIPPDATSQMLGTGVSKVEDKEIEKAEYVGLEQKPTSKVNYGYELFLYDFRYRRQLTHNGDPQKINSEERIEVDKGLVNFTWWHQHYKGFNLQTVHKAYLKEQTTESEKPQGFKTFSDDPNQEFFYKKVGSNNMEIKRTGLSVIFNPFYKFFSLSTGSGYARQNKEGYAVMAMGVAEELSILNYPNKKSQEYNIESNIAPEYKMLTAGVLIGLAATFAAPDKNKHALINAFSFAVFWGDLNQIDPDKNDYKKALLSKDIIGDKVHRLHIRMSFTNAPANRLGTSAGLTLAYDQLTIPFETYTLETRNLVTQLFYSIVLR